MFRKGKTELLIELYVVTTVLFKNAARMLFLGETVIEIKVYISTACDIESSRRLYVAIGYYSKSEDMYTGAFICYENKSM